MTRRGGGRRRRGTAIQGRRLALLAGALVLGYLGLGLRALRLQAVDADWLAARAQAQGSSTLRLEPLRGEIRDRHGTLLAATADVESVVASPNRIEDTRRVAIELAQALSLPSSELIRRLGSKRSFVWVKRWVTPAEAERVRALGLPGVSLQPERKRFYPSRELAASFLGFVGHDGEGLAGLELAFDEALRGSPTLSPALRAHGQKLMLGPGDPTARHGVRLITTLDAQLQHVAEKALTRALERTGARHATLVALDPRNGDLLAVAQKPGFDPNLFWREDPSAFRARAFVDSFEPGSTLKPFGIALALESGVVQTTTKFDCELGSWPLRDRVIHDFKPFATLTVHDILRLSSNIGAAKIAARLGSARLIEGLERFGFGERTGSGFPGEASGILHWLSETQDVERANVSFGQGIAVTPLQLVAGAAVLANGGLRVTPRLVLRLEGASGVLEWPREPGERVISERISRQVMEILRDAVRSGTGQAAGLAHHAVAGKTGTAQKVINGRYAHDRFVASFLGMIPAQNPRLVVAVVIDEPLGPHTGGQVAAPVFRELARFALEQLGLPREDEV